MFYSPISYKVSVVNIVLKLNKKKKKTESSDKHFLISFIVCVF